MAPHEAHVAPDKHNQTKQAGYHYYGAQSATASKEQINHQSGINQPSIRHQSTTIQPSIGHKSATNQPSIRHKSTTNQPSIRHKTTTNQPSIRHESTTNQPFIRHNSTTNQPSIRHKSTSHHPACLQWRAPTSMGAQRTTARRKKSRAPPVILSATHCFSPMRRTARMSLLLQATRKSEA